MCNNSFFRQVTVDTGSTDMLIPVAGCDGCKTNTTVYDPSSSKSSAIEPCSNKTIHCGRCINHSTQCGFEDTYLTCDLSNLTATCSVSGGIFRDTVYLGDLRAEGVRSSSLALTENSALCPNPEICLTLTLALPLKRW